MISAREEPVPPVTRTNARVDCRGNAGRVRHLLVDRDGVLNREDPHRAVHNPRDWKWETGALEALRLAVEHDLSVSIVTNQSAVARGEIDRDALDALHRWLAAQLEELGVRVVGVFACPHGRAGSCGCRKPRPGLLIEAIGACGIDPDATVMVGDDLRDLFAAEAAGVRSILVRTGKGASQQRFAPSGTVVADNLEAALRLLLDDPEGPIGGG